MSFRTKLDFSDNRQVKQHIKTKTVLSGATSFGVPYVDLPSGPDFSTSSITQTVTSFTSTFSGNSTTTNYTWYDSRMSLANNVLSAITPTTSAYTQNTGQVYTGNSYTIIDDNTVYSSYSGVSFDISATTFINLGGGNYSGSVHTNTLIILSYNSLDFTGRTIWNDVSGITRTDRLIVARDAQTGYVLSAADSEGMVEWVPTSGFAFTGGSGNCITDLYVTNVFGCSPITVHDDTIISGTTSKKLGINTSPSYTFELLSQDGSSNLVYDDTTDSQNLTLSGKTNGLYYVDVRATDVGILRLGVVGKSYTGATTFGTTGDSYVYSSVLSNGLNIISAPGGLSATTNDYIRFYAGNTATSQPDLHIQGSGATRGNIGIGTTDPKNTLHIKGGAGVLTLEGSDHVYINFYPDGYSAGRKGWFGYGNSTDDNISLTNQTVTGGTVFKTNDTARMFISASGNSGNVGIGTITPAELLDVNGTSRLRGIVKIGDLTSGDAAIEVGADRSFGGNAYIDLIGDTSYPDYGTRLIRNSGVSGNTVLAHRGSGLLSIGTQENGNLQFATNDTVRMYLSNSGNSGNIGIGTTSPTEKLDVNGRTKTTTIQITSGATNGYVLTSDVNGVGRWGKAASDIFTTGSTNNNAIYDIIGSHTLSGVSDYSIIAGGYTNKISASTYSGIFAGSGNTVDTAGFSVIVGGGRNSIKKNTDNLTYPKYSGIFAGYNNTIIPKSGETGEAFAGSYSVISGGKNNTISGHTISFIGGGDNNLIACDSGWNAIIGGKNNINHAADSVIIGGNGNLLGTSTTCASNTDNSAIVGGLGNTISNSYDAVTVGGNTNYISNSDDATIVGGNINNITNSDNAVTVGGNTHIISNSNYSIIAGGGINKISGTTYSGIFAGQNNSISGLTVTSGSSTNTTIIGGQNNLIYNNIPTGGLGSLIGIGSSDNSSIIGGKNNSIYGHKNSIILGGTGNTIHFDFPTVYNNSESILGSLKCGITSSTVSNITASSGSTINGSNQSSIIGGVGNSIASVDNSVIIGGSGNILGLAGSIGDNIVVIGCTNVIAQTDNMVYVPDLIIDGLISVTDLRTNASGQLIDGASDIRLKQNINQLQNSLSILKNLRGVSFEYTQESNMGSGLRYGFIAQEVQEFIPDIVRSRVKGDGMLSLSYTEIIPLLVEAVKELASGQTTSNNTYLETQSILAEDNNIDLNHNGSVESAVGGGIRVINAIGIDKHAELITDTDGNFITNNDFKPNALTIPVYTPTSSNDINGNEGNITRDSDYLYVKCNNIWKRTKLEEF